MNITSVAGSTSGSTIINVEPTLASGSSYKYKIAANPTMPNIGDLCRSGYTNWNGSEEIMAETGKRIVVAEVDSNNKCIGVGITSLVVK